MTQLNQHYAEKTKKWINDFVIQLNLCPFAKHVLDNNSLKIQVSPAENMNQALESLTNELNVLNTNSEIATTLLLFPFMLHNFFDYLDFVDLAHSRVLDVAYDGIYQLATFHPDYCFADVPFQDVTNYTNRSPYPMLHILREDQIEEAIAYYGNTEKIPENNINCLRRLGLDAIKEMALL